MKWIKCACCKHERMVYKPTELKCLRIKNGYSLKELSKITRISIGHLSDMERGRRNCSIKLTDFWNCTIKTKMA